MKNICVYCGSSPGALPDYRMAAQSLAKELVSRDISLVYGGASVGIMGEIADTVLELGGKAVGIIPQALLDKEVGHDNLTELHVVKSMHERKQMMEQLSDGFIAMPGGMGTLEELFEVMTWGQLGFHNKPCALFNVAGYYDHLIKFLDHTVAQKFVRPEHTSMLQMSASAVELIDKMQSYQPPVVSKWIKSDEI